MFGLLCVLSSAHFNGNKIYFRKVLKLTNLDMCIKLFVEFTYIHYNLYSVNFRFLLRELWHYFGFSYNTTVFQGQIKKKLVNDFRVLFHHNF